MKHFFCILLFSLLLVPSAFACGPFDRGWLAEEYYMFRLFGDNIEGNYPQSSLKAQYLENCKEWAKITSRTIPLDDIEQVVYKWSIEKLESLRTHGVYANNAFAKWLIDHHDNEVIDFLLLAKRNELVRFEKNSLWYYPVNGDEEATALQEILQMSSSYTGTRLKDRYLLQSIRALFACFQFEECINLWKKHENDFRTKIIKKLAADYIYGACERAGNTRILLELPLIKEMKERNLLYELQRSLHYKDNSTDKICFDEDYKKVLQVLQLKDIKYKAQWHYARAFLADKLGKREEAISSIHKTKTYATDTETKSVVRILEMYLRTKYAEVYDFKLENYLYGELLWLDNKIISELTPEIKERIKKNGTWNHICGYSQYYWNDMLRKIIIGNVVPLCIKSNYKTRALQYLNMADNGIFNKVPQIEVDYFKSDSDWIWKQRLLTWDEYRNSSDCCNDYDYRNDYFINLDSIGVKYVKRLAHRINNPISPLDSFLNKNSYTDQQYLYDIIGTQLIASRKYKEAASYLSHVSEEFQLSRNVVDYFNRDPFTLNKRLNQSDPFYKLHFAQKMSQLEYTMQNATNPNVRAESMLCFTLGMQNSVGENCWVLTSYYRGCWESYPFHSQYQYKLVNEIIAESEKLKQIAFTLFTDDERAAKAYQAWCMWKTTVTKYSNTEIAKQIHGQCDNLTDYQLSPNISFRFRNK